MDNPPYVPYQAYKSKRHSRGLSNQQSAPNSAPLQVQPRPAGALSNGHTYSEPVVPHGVGNVNDAEKPPNSMFGGRGTLQRPVSMIDTLMPPRQEPSPAPQQITRLSLEKPLPAPAIIPVPESRTLNQLAPPSQSNSTASSPPVASPPAASPSPAPTPPSPAVTLPSSPYSHASQTLSPKANGKAIAPPSPLAGPSTLSPAPSDRPVASPRKSSTFRHIRPPATRSTMTSSPLRPANTHARSSSVTLSSPRLPDSRLQEPTNGISSAASTPNMPAHDRALPPIPTFELHSQAPPSRLSTNSPSPASSTPTTLAPAFPPPRTSSLSVSPPQPPVPLPHAASSPALTPSTSVSSSVTVVSRVSGRSPAPYRPGFQPKGVYRPRTDEFIEARNHSRDVGRIERTRLERRLEKLINLHFPPPGQWKTESSEQRPMQQNRRASSFWDLDFSALKEKSAGDLWREVLQTQASQGSKNDIRAAEQKITPWEDDASVSQCPLCSASFHPLTNRKHHCRLCGRIICSLPVKYPQRPQTCSLLFVVDQSTGRIEEVGEGVDYGVRRRSTSNAGKKGETLTEEEKFLKGVRICRECRPVLLRQEYKQDMIHVPLFSRLYEAFISLEKEIEEELPIFQELMISLSKQEAPTPEASAARKRLLEAFAQYDALAKRIRKLPCAPGSSQDRVQNAVLTRANLFLQKHMFPLQSLPKPKKAGATASPSPAPPDDQIIDPDSEVARVLQPLLEQEALLETFVEEAKAHRKFEDVKTLKNNLREIRAEIERILANAEEQVSSRQRTRTSSG